MCKRATTLLRGSAPRSPSVVVVMLVKDVGLGTETSSVPGGLSRAACARSWGVGPASREAGQIAAVQSWP